LLSGKNPDECNQHRLMETDCDRDSVSTLMHGAYRPGTDPDEGLKDMTTMEVDWYGYNVFNGGLRGIGQLGLTGGDVY
jgi:hypothetical protein